MKYRIKIVPDDDRNTVCSPPDGWYYAPVDAVLYLCPKCRKDYES